MKQTIVGISRLVQREQGKRISIFFVIPKRIRRVSDRDGLVVILGYTKGTLQRNIIEPLQKFMENPL